MKKSITATGNTSSTTYEILGEKVSQKVKVYMQEIFKRRNGDISGPEKS